MNAIKMTHLLAVAAGGAAGAMLRYSLSLWVHGLLGRGFPYGTLTVNVLGSLLMGFLYIVLVERFSLSVEWRAVLLVGLLGSFTTFATFTLETMNLFEQGEQIKALLNILFSVILCITVTWLGMLMGRQI